MQRASAPLAAADGAALFVHGWRPEAPARSVVQIVHGMAEHGGRYARLAAALTDAGCAVYAGDLRGHGRSAPTPGDLGFFAARGGWRKCLDDIWRVNRRIAADHPGAPIILLAHSMGSFLAQHFIGLHGDSLAGVVLSGTSGKPSALAVVGRLIARLERLRRGPRGRSALLQSLAFDGFNKQFAPARTAFDWLSRDTDEVDKYIADPLCGFPVSIQLWIDVLDGLGAATTARHQARIPKHLPIYVISGSRDPVGGNTHSVTQLLAAYRQAGLDRITHRFYADARHELFNETNRDEVTRDLLSWLAAVTA